MDMAKLLSEAGFEVIMRTDADLEGMEKALEDFGALIEGKDSVLFFYAGHGVQIGGENYLIPVKEDIRTETQARTRTMPLSDVLERIRKSSVHTALVFLDACRDKVGS